MKDIDMNDDELDFVDRLNSPIRSDTGLMSDVDDMELDLDLDFDFDF